MKRFGGVSGHDFSRAVSEWNGRAEARSANGVQRFERGHDFSRAAQAGSMGFSPCAADLSG